MARPERFELPTPRFVVWGSLWLLKTPKRAEILEISALSLLKTPKVKEILAFLRHLEF
jgi:hypothetical protein